MSPSIFMNIFCNWVTIFSITFLGNSISTSSTKTNEGRYFVTLLSQVRKTIKATAVLCFTLAFKIIESTMLYNHSIAV